MPTLSVATVLRELYSAPLEAAVAAESEYRRIWATWLREQLALVTDAAGDLRPGVDLAALLQTAPVVRVDGRVDVAITMRIAAVRESQGGVSGGLQLGPIHASGSFGFMNRTTEESVLQASTVVVISNTDQSLVDYLAKHNVPVPDADGVKNAIAFLDKAQAPAGGGGGNDNPADGGNGGGGNA
ncbi:MAG TPA: hypothetical protein VF092_04520 [Longimicrobium sp.]